MTTERIPRDFINQLLARVDIVDLIDGRVPLRKKSSNNYFACCPFHAEKSASFSVSQNKQFYHCFGCGAHGNAIDFMMQFDRLSFPEAVEHLAQQMGMTIPKEFVSHKTTAHPELHELLANIAKFYQSELRKTPHAIQYLKQRGLSGEIAKTFGIGYAPSAWDRVLQMFGSEKQQLLDTGMIIKKEDGGSYDRFRDRITFPIHDRRGRVIGFGGRIIEKGEPKYLNSPETPVFQKGHELYGLYQALQIHRQLEKVLIVEGYMDVVALFQHEVTYAVATLGTATTTHHLQRLFKYTHDIVFCFDGDAAGRTAAWRALLVALPIVRDDIQMRFMFLPEGEDPDSLIRKEGKTAFETRIQSAPTLSHFFFQSMNEQVDINTPDSRARYVKLATEHLKSLPEGIFKKMMLEELEKRARVDLSEFKKTSVASIEKKAHIRAPSALRLAITLLVQEPQLAHEVISLPDGYDLLFKLVEMIKLNDIRTTGTLLEYWRDTEEFKILAKLAEVELMTPKNGTLHEFLGAISKLHKLAHKNKIEVLLSKAALQGLDDEEKQLLHGLIHEKNYSL